MIFPYLSIEEILRVHYRVIEDFGGAHGIRDEGRLKSVTEAPRQKVFNKAQYGSVCEQAAVYLRNIIGDHPFIDGNKRTGVTVCGVSLARNKKVLIARPKEVESSVARIAVERLGIPEIDAWLVNNTRDITGL